MIKVLVKKLKGIFFIGIYQKLCYLQFFFTISHDIYNKYFFKIF